MRSLAFHFFIMLGGIVLIPLNLVGSEWAQELNREYGTKLQSVELKSLPENHYLRKVFSPDVYQLYAEIGPEQSLHGGFLVTSRQNDTILAHGRFEQGMLHGDFEIRETANSHLALRYQFGRLVEARQIFADGSEKVRDFNLPPQPQAIHVRSKILSSELKSNFQIPREDLAKIAKQSFKTDTRVSVGRMLAAFEQRLEGKKVSTSSPANHEGTESSRSALISQKEVLEEKQQKPLTDKEFMSSLKTEFVLSSIPATESGDIALTHPQAAEGWSQQHQFENFRFQQGNFQ